MLTRDISQNLIGTTYEDRLQNLCSSLMCSSSMWLLITFLLSSFQIICSSHPGRDHTHFIRLPACKTGTVPSAITYTILCIFLSGYQGKINCDRAIDVRKITVLKKKYNKSAISGFAWRYKTAELHKKVRPLGSLFSPTCTWQKKNTLLKNQGQSKKKYHR